MFLYKNNTSNSKQFGNNEKIPSYCKQETKKQNGQPMTPFYSQNQIIRTENSHNIHITNSIETTQIHYDYRKTNYQRYSKADYPIHEKSLKKNSLNTSNDIYAEQKQTQAPIDKDNNKAKQSTDINSNICLISFVPSKCKLRRVFSVDNSLNGSYNIDQCSPLKDDLNCEQKVDYHPNNEKFNNNKWSPIHHMANHSIALIKGTECIEQTHNNTNLLSSHVTTNKINGINSNNNESLQLPSLIALYQLEERLRKGFNNPNFTSKTKQYNLIKSIFEELIQLFPTEHQVILSELLSSYHQVVLSFSKENKGLKEANSSFKKRLAINEKKHFEVLSLLKWKENEIDLFKKKQSEYKKALSFSLKSPSPIGKRQSLCSDEKGNQAKGYQRREDSTEINNSGCVAENKKNIEDLEGLYFPDKVPIGSNLISNQSIPTLQLNHDTINKNELKPKRTRVIYSKILKLIEKEDKE